MLKPFLGLEPKIRVRAHDSSKDRVVKYSVYCDLGRGHNAAARLGFEPRLMVPETTVLPLDDRAIKIS